MATTVPYKAIDEIPGWFRRMDMELFRQLLDQTEERLGGGDLAELGAYLGQERRADRLALSSRARRSR